jgi:hypothetical protein
MNFKYILKIVIVVSLILSLIVFINSIGLNLNAKKLLTMEGLTNPPDTSIIINKSDAFCEIHRGSSGALDKSCDSKCVAGGAGGPTFNSDSNGKTKELDYYYFQNKCHGTKCP